VNSETYGTEQLLADLRAYTCPVHGCDSSLRSNSLMCRGHWALVPADQKREVYEQVRRLERIGKRYERAEPGSARQGALATEYLTEEDQMREIQLRAVIVASERAGARPEPVGSAGQTTPRKGGSMKIRVLSGADTANVELLDADGGVTSCIVVEPGQEVELTTANTPDNPVEVGEVCGTAERTAAAETGESGETAGEGEASGEGAGAGEGEGAASGEGEGSAAGEGSATP